MGVVAAQAEDSASGCVGGELLVLDLPRHVSVVGGAHEPRVPLLGSAGVTEVF